jgi:hypothetical protein
MTAEEARVLWVRFLAGRSLSPGEEAGLVRALEADPALRAGLIEDCQFDGMLKSLGAARANGEAFERELADCVAPERDATRFVRKVEQRLASRRFLRMRTPGVAWKAALAAAGVFLAVLMVATAMRPAPVRAPLPKPAPGFAIVPEPEPSPRAEPRPRRQPERPAPVVEPKTEPVPVPDVVEPAPRKPVAEASPVLPPVKEKGAAAPVEKTVVSPAAPPPPVPEVDRVDGDVYVFRTPTDKPRLKRGDKVAPGCQIDVVNASGSATLRFADGTVLEIGPSSLVRDVADGPKRVDLAHGSVRAIVKKQPEGRPMTLVTRDAEATVLGTVLRLSANRDPKLGTTLEVEEGRVRFTRPADGRSTDVSGGQFAVMAAGAEPSAQKRLPDTVIVNFGPSGPSPDDVLNDGGEEFAAGRGYGWKGANLREPIAGLIKKDGLPELKGRSAVVHPASPANVDRLKTSHVAGGSARHTETWMMAVPNGKYLVKVCVGDLACEQGPHHVAIEGIVLINDQFTATAKFFEVEQVVEVRDGELTMTVGKPPSGRISFDGSTDTILNFIKIQKLK